MTEERKPQLHELLAVEGDLKGEKDKIRDEAIHTFKTKTAHFLGAIKELKLFDAGRASEEQTEYQEMVTTVLDKLKYTSNSFIRFWDAKYQKESANQNAKADVIVEGTTIAKDVPVTFLLAMEEELKQLRQLYGTVPTLKPGISWKKSDLKEDVYIAEHDIEKFKTEKIVQHKILVDPTDKHPAQIEKWYEDKPVGKYITKNEAGMITPAEKSILLRRIDQILRAVKKARQQANNQEVAKIQIGKSIFDFVHTK